MTAKPAMSGRASNTVVSLVGDNWHINGLPTFPDRVFAGHTVEGLLPNCRMVQAVFDDLNPQTRPLWAYPDGPFDADRNTREFVDAMPVWRRHGLLAITVNLQGGSPQGYSKEQPWINTAFAEDGSLRAPYLDRLGRVLDRADELGMVVILGLFYFGQDERLRDEAAVIRAVDEATDWVIARQDRHVVIELSNECNIPKYEHGILLPSRIGELIERVQHRSAGRVDAPAGRLLCSVSFSGGYVPDQPLMSQCDYVLLHGNGVSDPLRIADMIDRTRASSHYRGQPIVFNEDDHEGYDQPINNFTVALSRHASWGHFDYRRPGESFDEGYQSVPANWQLSSHRKRDFFRLLSEITGSDAGP